MKEPMMPASRKIVSGVGQVALGGFLGFAGHGHLTRLRREFRAQVPPWIPLDPDTVVVASGIAELGLGAALLVSWRQPWRGRVGALTAAFFVAIFPGNVAQFVEHRDAFGLDTDAKRAVRLLFQPVLVAWALGATGALASQRTTWRRRRSAEQPSSRGLRP